MPETAIKSLVSSQSFNSLATRTYCDSPSTELATGVHRQRMHAACGFTLVELVIVIVLVAILAVTVAPRIFSDRGIEEATLEPRILSMLRLQQQRAMQDTLNPCFGVTFSATQITPKDCNETVANDRILNVPSLASINVVSALTDGSSGFLFNSLGCPVSNGHETNAEACGQSSVELQIDGVENRRICVQSEGYIRSGSCN